MKLTRTLRCSLLVAGVALGAAPASRASTTSFGAPSDCVTSSGDTLTWSAQGLSNPNTVAEPLECPAHWTGTLTSLDSSTATVFYSDISTLDGFSCYFVARSDTATVYMGTTKYSCGTSGGCTSASVSYTGAGNLALPAFSTGTKISAAISCMIPRQDTVASHSSILLGYSINVP